MKLYFKSDINLTKSIWLYQTFGPPDGVTASMRAFPALIGKTFYNAASINHRIGNLPESYKTLFEFIFNEKLDKKTKRLCGDIISDIENKLQIYDKESYGLAKTKSLFAKILDNRQKTLASEVKKIFGFELPEELWIVFTETLDQKGSSGSMLYAKSGKVVISIETPYNNTYDKEWLAKHVLAITAHEMLHGLIRSNDVLNKKYHDDWFEEAVLDYFVPNGVLARKLDMAEAKTIRELFEFNAKNRPYARIISKKLMPIMHNYVKIRSGTIWGYLLKTEFRKYIITGH